MAVKYSPPGSYKTPAEFRVRLAEIDSTFACDLEVQADGPLSRPLSLYGRELANRFAVHPMEGWDGTRDGAPSDHTRRRWRRFGESGAALIWGGEAIAVRHDGRANPNQLFINPAADNVRIFADLRQELMGAHGTRFGSASAPLVGLQLTHSGRFSRPNHEGLEPRIAYHHPLYSRKYPLPVDYPVLSDSDLERIRDDFVAAARIAQAAGFDFIDIKSCHAYLIHELLSAFDRPGKYGGDFGNRTRFLREVIAGVRAECPGLEIGVRVGLTDLPPHVAGPQGIGQPMDYAPYLPWRLGFGMAADDPVQADWREPLALLGMLASSGIRMVNVSIGTPYGSAHLQRPAAFPPSDGYWPPADPLVAVFRQLQAARIVKSHFPDLVVVGTGYSYLQDYLPHVAQHEVGFGRVDFVGLGRMVLSYPDLPADVLAGRPLQRKRICRTFSDCTTGPRNHLLSGCFPLDDYYRAMPAAAAIRGFRPKPPG
jgi:2,4-dienoyl-CoA reductase-like NADH-dependent reductase (Old Yellow Enzyme family)